MSWITLNFLHVYTLQSAVCSLHNKPIKHQVKTSKLKASTYEVMPFGFHFEHRGIHKKVTFTKLTPFGRNLHTTAVSAPTFRKGRLWCVGNKGCFIFASYIFDGICSTHSMIAVKLLIVIEFRVSFCVWGSDFCW